MLIVPSLLLLLLLLLLLQHGQPAAASKVSRGGDRNCSSGLLDSAHAFCCGNKCDRCGGGSCQNHPGGRSECCTSAIKNSHRYCDSSQPPCIMVRTHQPAPNFISRGRL